MIRSREFSAEAMNEKMHVEGRRPFEMAKEHIQIFVEYPTFTGSSFIDAQFTFVGMNNSVHLLFFLANIPERSYIRCFIPSMQVPCAHFAAAHRSILNFLNTSMNTVYEWFDIAV